MRVLLFLGVLDLAGCVVPAATLDASFPPADSSDAPSSGAADAALTDALDAGSQRCAVPPGAAPTIRAAFARPGATCTRYPFALGAPREVLEAADGTIYVTEQRDGRVVRLASEGFVPVATGLHGPIGLRQSADGTLYLVQEGDATLSALDPRTGALRVIATNDRAWTYLTFGPDGAAYLSAFTGDVDGTGALRRVLPSNPGAAPTDFATGLWVPEATVFRPDGSLLVAEWGAWGAEGAPRTRVSVLPPGGGAGSSAPSLLREPLQRVYGLALAPSGGVYVADTAGRVLFTRDGASVETVLTDVAVPTGMTVARDGALLVTEHGSLDHSADGYLLVVRGL